MKFKISQTQQYFLGIIIFTLLVIFFYIKQQKIFLKIIEKPVYSISKITGIKHYNRKEDSYKYEFTFLGEKFERGIGESSSNNLFVGKRYFVIFEKGNPKNSMLIPFIFVPDSITKAPDEGWVQPPIPIDKNEIKKFLENY
ncbi:hypothetical protein SAMN05443634_1086 [Chishuiella changwenlii]|uniref:DUF3592 domain-containing protein n=1 Tax=Chishuiella changwenlii TaxID=1434701 RepID=A0A1M6ZQ00_9FLAO|nr:hypothetical protein [Chishuiella changwenlii]GGE92949.1 hypothetical protein GCM10010984_08190 [Chishuiella changwenlii]SHL32413.1 hypothetical protein SAMN05443634_1086 [Chishuiella changwenlii]